MALGDSSRAIGAVTRLLQDQLIRRGFEVAIGKPEEAAKNNSNQKLNLYLFETRFDPQLRNQALGDGQVPPLWLVLKYLLTAFDVDENSDSAAAHDLLGRGIAALQEIAVLRLDALVPLDVRKALENNPEPLKLSFDDAPVDLVAKTMQGSDERYRLSVAFQVRPVLIVPATLPRGSLLVGVDYSTAPQTVIGRDGVQIEVSASMGATLLRVEPPRVEIGASFTLFGEDLQGSEQEVLLGDVPLLVLERAPDRLKVLAQAASGAPLENGTRLSAGELPLIVRRRLLNQRFRSSNLLAATLLPTLASANWVGNDLHLQGLLLGTASDDVLVLLYRENDGATVRLFDSVATSADQHSLTIAAAKTGVPIGSYRVILQVNNQQALGSPAVAVP